MGLICILFVIYPYTIYPLILYFLPRKHIQIIDDHAVESLKVALVFCAYNEERALPEKIENIRELKKIFPALEVYAYSDASTDQTNDILNEANDVLHPVIGEERIGKVLGMQKLLSKTDSEIIIFTDANVNLDAQCLPKLIKYFSNPEIGCVSCKLLYKEIDTTTAKVGGLYWKLEEKIKSLESQTGSTMGADGAIFARRREGYPDIPPNMVDDMAASMSIIFDKKQCISASDVVAYENAVSSSAEEFRRKMRIACGSYSTYLYQRNHIKKMSLINRFKFISHKLLRWWGGLFIILSVISFILWGFSIGYGQHLLLAVLSGTGLFILAAKAGIPGFSSAYEILSAIFATALGVIEALNGKEYKTWETADTR